MEERNPRIHLYSGTRLSVMRLKDLLEEDGITPLIEDDKAVGLSAGFAGGTDSTVRLYVTEKDLPTAQEVLAKFEQT